jgi:F-type H+-transporting ATPase subunit epsilon
MSYKLSIVSPGGRAFEGQADSLTAPGVAGEFGVLTGHAPMIAATRRGIARVQTGGTSAFFVTGPGVCEVTQEGVNLLASNVSKAATLEEAQKELARLQAATGGK